MSAFVAHLYKIQLVDKAKPLLLRVADGRDVSSGAVKHETKPMEFELPGCSGKTVFSILGDIDYDVILGLDWLAEFKPTIDWGSRVLTFPTTAVDGDDAKVLTLAHTEPSAPLPPTENDRAELETPETADELTNDQADMNEPLSDPSGESVSTSTPAAILPSTYQDFACIFDKANADILPAHRKYDIGIDLTPDARIPWGPIYRLPEPELAVLRDYLDDHLKKGFIRPSRSPAGAPVLFVKKKDGSLRLCVDYRALNAITTPNRAPLPLIDSLLPRLRNARVFSKVDLRGAYNLVRIRPGDEWKTAFRCQYGHYEYLVMPFGLTNAPAVFQSMMDDIFRDFLDQFVVVYLDDILIFSDTLEAHVDHVRQVLQRLKDHNLHAKLEKCEFHVSSTAFLGYVVSDSGLSMDPEKVRAIQDWPAPTKLRDLQSFLGFANFYRRFVPNYSTLALPMTKLTHRKTDFVFDSEATTSFAALKSAFATAFRLHHANFERPMVIECDASDFALGAVLFQYGDDGRPHPTAFYSRKLTSAELNYPVYDKELLAIVVSLKQWRPFLLSSPFPITVFTDHQNLQYWTASRTLNRRQARWSLELADYDFVIQYRPGCRQIVADSLSRRPDYALTPEDEFKTTVLQPSQFIAVLAPAPPADETTPAKSLLEHIRAALASDSWATSIRSSPTTDFAFRDDGLLYAFGLIYVPSAARPHVFRAYHDAPSSGHPGALRTLEQIARYFWFPRLRHHVKRYVAGCDICTRSKPVNSKPAGLLLPLSVPSRPWSSISMDFIVALPPSSGYDAVWVVVDRLTKLAHFVPTRGDLDAPGLAALFLQNIYRLHGLPANIISDRGSLFTSHFWTELCRLLHVQRRLSTAFHPQTDGQTERVNQILEQFLRCYITHRQDDWTDWLPLAEYAYNNSFSV